MDWMKKTVTLLWITSSFTGFAGGANYFPAEALSAVSVGLPKGHTPSNAQCLGCHKREFEDWEKSRHSRAFNNQNFLEGYFREPQERCLNCHTPLREQVQEIKQSPTLKLAHEGVNCITCHVREGKVQSSRSSGDSYHTYVENDFLKSPRFCASCHEFSVNAVEDGAIHLTATNAQSTYSEWKRYQAAGGMRTCQDCHMPDGRHMFHGAHGSTKNPLRIQFRREPRRTVLTIWSEGVGHNFPSGDVFRRLTLEVRGRGERAFKVVETFGRRYGESGGFRLLSNTTLRSFERRELVVNAARPFEFRLVYHFMKDVDKKSSLTTLAERERILERGTIGDL